MDTLCLNIIRENKMNAAIVNFLIFAVSVSFLILNFAIAYNH